MKQGCAQRFIIAGILALTLVLRAGVGMAAEAMGNPLASVRLGESLKELYLTHGSPWITAYQNKIGYWTYSIDSDRAWLVIGVSGGTVHSVQVLAKAYQRSLENDDAGITLGDNVEKVKSLHASLAPKRVDMDKVLEVAGADGVKRFYGLSPKTGLIDRIGRTLDDETLPLLIRWYVPSGWTPDRAIPVAASGGTSVGETRYLNGLRGAKAVYSFQCSGGNTWMPVARKQTTVDRARLDEVHARCGESSYIRTFYFALSNKEPRAFDDDDYSQALLAKAGVSDPTALPALHHKRSTLGTITPQIWFTTPNGARWLNGYYDSSFAFIYDPTNPPTTITFSFATDGSAPSLLVRHRNDHTPLSAILGAYSVSCGFSLNSHGGNGKCGNNPPSPTPPCPSVKGDNGMSTTSCNPTTGDPKNQPHNKPGVAGANSNAAGGGHGNVGSTNGGRPGKGNKGDTGCPIYAVSGKLWYTQEDFSLSGPFGMLFNHRYDSDFGTYQGDLGMGWRHTYGAYLDLTNLSIGGVVFYDANCNQEYFGTVGPGTTVYDQFAGGSLTATASGSTITGFTVTTWDHRVLTFDASGRLMSLQDRIGNTQTIARDGSHRISTITDQLGRSLSFSYDGSNRIISIGSTPGGISVTLTYDSGTNCYTGDLCTVTESDGSVWNYQYYDPSTMGGNHLLYEVIDPLSHIEEANTYAQINLGNGDNHYRVTHQEQQGGKNAYDYAYSISGDTGTTSISNSTVGQTTTYTWDQALQQVLSVSGPLCECDGSNIAYTYDLFGRILTVSEGGIKTRSFSYGRDKIFTSPDGLTTYVSTAYPSVTDTYDYNIKTLQGPATRHVQYAYYPLTDSRSDLANTITEPSVDTLGNTVTTTQTYSTNGLLTSSARQGYINGTSTTYTTSYAYDGLGRITSVTGPRTDVTQQTTFSYYPDTDTDLARRGQLETMSRYVSGSLSLTTTYALSSLPSPYNTYSIFGGPGSVVDPNGVVSELDYNQRGNLYNITLKGVSGDPTDLVTFIDLDAMQRVAGILPPLGNFVGFYYLDGTNNLTDTIRYDSSIQAHEHAVWAYDAVSEPTSLTLQSCPTPTIICPGWVTQNSRTYAYTSAGNLASVSYPTGGSQNLTWDTSGNNTSSTLGDSSYSVTTSSQYDAAHNTTLNGLGNLQFSASLYTHDLQGNLDSVTQRLQSSATSSYQHDDFGRVRKSRSPYTGTQTYQYDAAGNLTSHTDANGAVTATTYDPLNRPLSAVSTKGGSSETVTWSYDDPTSGTYRLGRLYQTTDPSGSKTYTYDRRGNVTQSTQIANGTTYTTSYGYDGNGNRTSMTLPSGRVVTYTFDFADRPYSVSGAYGGTTTTYVSSATYEPYGPRMTTVFGNGTTQALSYNQRYLLTENKLTNTSTTLSDLTYTENATGFITQVTDNLESVFTRTYTYGGHATNMMTQIKSVLGQGNYADAYAQNLTQALFPGHMLAFKLSQNISQLQSVFNQGTGVSTAVSFDSAGNESTIGSATYAYSPRNLLASGDGITYTYDGFGQRVSATTTISGSSATETSLYGPDRHLEMETSLSGGTVAYDYVWLGDTPVGEEDIAGGHTYWTSIDHTGAAFILTDNTATRVWLGDYEPFGALYQARIGTSIHQPLRFPGQEAELFDGSQGVNGFSGRYYNGARWYRPQWGRYTQADPLGYAGSTYNLYEYANNNPINEIDPNGGFAAVLLAPIIATPVVGEVVGTAILIGIGGYVIYSAVNDYNVYQARGQSSGGDNTGYEEAAPSAPPNSIPLNETDWSGNHGEIKPNANAGPATNVKIDPDDNVWVQNPDGTWRNEGPVESLTNQKALGRTGKDRQKGRSRRC